MYENEQFFFCYKKKASNNNKNQEEGTHRTHLAKSFLYLLYFFALLLLLLPLLMMLPSCISPLLLLFLPPNKNFISRPRFSLEEVSVYYFFFFSSYCIPLCIYNSIFLALRRPMMIKKIYIKVYIEEEEKKSTCKQGMKRRSQEVRGGKCEGGEKKRARENERKRDRETGTE